MLKNMFKLLTLASILLLIGTVAVIIHLKVDTSDDSSRVVIGRMNDSLSLDPAITSDTESFQITANIYETLIISAQGGTSLMPGLAESWKVSDDGLTWHFKIRKGIKFHDGTLLNAHVVAFNFQRWMDPNSPYHTGDFVYWNYSFGGFPGIVRTVTALSNETLEIVLTEPYAPFLSTLSMPAFGIASQTALLKYNDALKTHPVGTGPFIFKSWEKNDRIILKRNDNYWNGRAKAPEIEFRVLPSGADKIALLKSGEVNIIDQLSVEEVDAVNADDTLRLYYRPFINIGYLALNNKIPPFNDARVRKAISLLIDKESLLNDSYKALFRSANSFLPPVILGYHEGIKSDLVNIEEAKSLLAQSGYPNGFDVTLWVMDRPRNYFPNPSEIGNSIKSQLSKANINVTMNIITWDRFIEDIRLGTHQMALTGWNGDIADPDNFLYTLFASADVKSQLSFNHSGYENERVDELLMQARRVTDEDFRITLYREIQEIIYADAASIPLMHTMTAIGTDIRVKGFEPHITGEEIFMNLEIVP
ncbi:MAG: ABC transporter substrate-binding protein [Firmicutes bacterium]|nr:ABC transporter substrate-binding protein [Bacillota bacterium]